MRRNAKSISTSPEIIRHIDGLTEANFKLLTQLIGWLAGHEKQHTKYRAVMIDRLARLEAAISLILVGQRAQILGSPTWHQPEMLEEDARWAEEFIARQSNQIGMKMIHAIYSNDPAPEPRHDSRRKWTGWEI